MLIKKISPIDEKRKLIAEGANARVFFTAPSARCLAIQAKKTLS